MVKILMKMAKKTIVIFMVFMLFSCNGANPQKTEITLLNEPEIGHGYGIGQNLQNVTEKEITEVVPQIETTMNESLLNEANQTKSFSSNEQPNIENVSSINIDTIGDKNSSALDHHEELELQEQKIFDEVDDEKIVIENQHEMEGDWPENEQKSDINWNTVTENEVNEADIQMQNTIYEQLIKNDESHDDDTKDVDYASLNDTAEELRNESWIEIQYYSAEDSSDSSQRVIIGQIFRAFHSDDISENGTSSDELTGSKNKTNKPKIKRIIIKPRILIEETPELALPPFGMETFNNSEKENTNSSLKRVARGICQNCDFPKEEESQEEELEDEFEENGSKEEDEKDELEEEEPEEEEPEEELSEEDEHEVEQSEEEEPEEELSEEDEHEVEQSEEEAPEEELSEEDEQEEESEEDELEEESEEDELEEEPEEEGADEDKPDEDLDVEGEKDVAPSHCQIPEHMDHSELVCKIKPSVVKCLQKCVFGHTVKEGTARTQVCRTDKNRWTPSRRFSDCKPFIDCTIRLKPGGKKKCYTNYKNQGNKCYVSCKGYADKETVKRKLYTCNIQGKWEPELPHCAKAGSGLRLVPRPAKDQPHTEDTLPPGRPRPTRVPRPSRSPRPHPRPRPSPMPRPTPRPPRPSRSPSPHPRPRPTRRPRPHPRPRPSRRPRPHPRPRPSPMPRPTPRPRPSPMPRPTPRPRPSRSPRPHPRPRPTPMPRPTRRPRPHPRPRPSRRPRPHPRPRPSGRPRPHPRPRPTPRPRPSPMPRPTPRPRPSPMTRPTPRPRPSPMTRPTPRPRPSRRPCPEHCPPGGSRRTREPNSWRDNEIEV